MVARMLGLIGTICLVMLGGIPTTSPPAGATTSALCGSMADSTPHITKVLWVFMENVSYGTGVKQIPGNPNASYIDHTLLSQCGSTSNYHAVSHPSYPNYLAATSGSTQGVVSDTLGLFSGPSIFAQVDPSWRSYEEFMPKGCDHVGQTGTSTTHQYYVGRHNPAASYSSLPVGAPTAGDCPSNDVALGTATSGALQQDVASGSLPAFSVVTPGLCDDMHTFPTNDTGCPSPVKTGDSWLAQWIPGRVVLGREVLGGHRLDRPGRYDGPQRGVRHAGARSARWSSTVAGRPALVRLGA